MIVVRVTQLSSSFTMTCCRGPSANHIFEDSQFFPQHNKKGLPHFFARFDLCRHGAQMEVKIKMERLPEFCASVLACFHEQLNSCLLNFCYARLSIKTCS